MAGSCGGPNFITKRRPGRLYLVFAPACPSQGGRRQRLPGACGCARPEVGPLRQDGPARSPTRELVLDDVRCPPDALCTRREGFAVAMRALRLGRSASPARPGVAGAALQEAIASPRAQPLGARCEFEGVQFHARRHGHPLHRRSPARISRRALARRMPFTKEASIAKLFCTDTAMEIATDALQLARGLRLSRQPALRAPFRDAKALQIYEARTRSAGRDRPQLLAQ